MRKIVVGTRKSALALTQTNQVIAQLEQICKRDGIECEFEVHKIVTKGDQILDVTLSKVGGKGLFVKEIEQALLDNVIDIAVHSMKDMPADLADGLTIGAIPERVDPRDCLISRGGVGLDALPTGARVGTSSLRRACQLKFHRPDLQVESIRGNIDSRLKKLESEDFDAILLAAAGLHRMGWTDRVSAFLTADACVPAVGQGALGIECRAGDGFMLDLLRRFQHEATARCVRAERSFLRSLNGGCQVPIGAYGRIAAPEEAVTSGGDADVITLTGIVGSPDGAVLLRATVSGTLPEELGEELAQLLKAQGAEQILADVRG
ncbi:hydroxymethylbilane synthase [Paenibacillus psychroresistens]|uniref:Porphobilinogen deaminase n=1 Tax=Paenibacillus psychroresistens TaxID=1778678 RepID=A0A6B8RJ68_9BACL|nr:hydroxymethylbilane synthase [Paenibacillus psychroresistens]QGQ95368.1 hydroxymethylbilane synthase [Paenibacillus psychroresistens]